MTETKPLKWWTFKLHSHQPYQNKKKNPSRSPLSQPLNQSEISNGKQIKNPEIISGKDTKTKPLGNGGRTQQKKGLTFFFQKRQSHSTPRKIQKTNLVK